MEGGELQEAKILGDPVFIGGQYGSGTWLVTEFVEAHSGIAFLDEETHFYRYFEEQVLARTDLSHKDSRAAFLRKFFEYKKFSQLGFSKQEIVAAVTSDANRKNKYDIEDFFESIWMLGLSSRPEKTSWGDKSPLSELYWPRIKKKYPGAKFIYCVRDPRAVYASNRRRFSSDLDVVIVDWKSSIMALLGALAHIPSSDLFLVKYEDFCSADGRARDELLAFLGANNFAKNQSSTGKKNIPDRATLKFSDGVSQSAVSKWKEEISKREQKKIETLAGRLMAVMGYESPKIRLRDYLAHPNTLRLALKMRY